MITSRARYALKTMLHLARADSGQLVQANDIADEEHIPIKFLEQILIDLRRAGLVSSTRGRYGGYQLAAPAKDILLLRILRAIDGPVAPLSCLSQTAYVACTDCDDEELCGVRNLMEGAYKASIRYMENTTLADGIVGRGRKMSTNNDGEAFGWKLDDWGFLENFNHWDRDFAQAMAERIGMPDKLSDKQWGVLEYIRSFFRSNGQCPLVFQTCRANKLRLREFNQLFPSGYLRGACRLAGLTYTAGYPTYAILTQYVDGPEEADDILAQFKLDDYGFLLDAESWNRSFATAMTTRQGGKVPLTDAQWRVLEYMREKYTANAVVPTVIQTCEDLELELDDLEDLFPAGYNRGAVRCAGLRPATGG